ncbi:MAG: GAF domain-containing protein [Bacilli bacterium]|nr:GAF domain-containing protein [Bacilli bacterium]
MKIINENASLLSNLSNICAYLKLTLNDISWVGFYLVNQNKLILGPFQGNVACTTIDVNNGVCGKAFRTKEIQIIPNVHELSYHIACDKGSNSELVIPLIINDEVKMVLDIDSYSVNRFTEYNEEVKELCQIIEEIKQFILINHIENYEKLINLY